VSEERVVARSPIAPAPPVVVADDWEVSGRRAAAELTITDCTPLTKVQLRAPAGGQAAAALGVRFGRAARDGAGTLVAGSGPGEWLLLAAPGRTGGFGAIGVCGVPREQSAPPGQPRAQALEPERIAAVAPGEHVTWVDLTHGRALIRLTGSPGPRLLAKLCGIDLGDDITPDGAAFRTSIAALATDVIRDDLLSADGRTRSYLLHCERSSGQYLFDAMLRAGAEFGIEIDGFRMPDALPARLST
jgi:heterotetrameric sarcosine oxidase gamma subunit